MKNIFKILLLLVLNSLLFVTCTEDALDENSIFGREETEMTEVDIWLQNNFTIPFNIDIMYKMEDLETDMGFTLVPAKSESSLAFCKLLKYLWIEPFIELEKSPSFLQLYAPRIFHLIGSGGYNTSGTVLLGTAEGGLKVTIYRINEVANLTPSEMGEYYFKTVYHEFFHILHQKIEFDVNYQKISYGEYVSGDWYLYGLQEALNKGFITQYSRMNEFEDFVEVASVYIVYGKEHWDEQLSKASDDGRQKLEEKLTVIKSYFYESWDIDIDTLQKIYSNRINDKFYIDNLIN